jgi:hypothetical protein
MTTRHVFGRRSDDLNETCADDAVQLTGLLEQAAEETWPVSRLAHQVDGSGLASFVDDH